MPLCAEQRRERLGDGGTPGDPAPKDRRHPARLVGSRPSGSSGLLGLRQGRLSRLRSLTGSVSWCDDGAAAAPRAPARSGGASQPVMEAPDAGEARPRPLASSTAGRGGTAGRAEAGTMSAGRQAQAQPAELAGRESLRFGTPEPAEGGPPSPAGRGPRGSRSRQLAVELTDELVDFPVARAQATEELQLLDRLDGVPARKVHVGRLTQGHEILRVELQRRAGTRPALRRGAHPAGGDARAPRARRPPKGSVRGRARGRSIASRVCPCFRYSSASARNWREAGSRVRAFLSSSRRDRVRLKSPMRSDQCTAKAAGEKGRAAPKGGPSRVVRNWIEPSS